MLSYYKRFLFFCFLLNSNLGKFKTKTVTIGTNITVTTANPYTTKVLLSLPTNAIILALTPSSSQYYGWFSYGYHGDMTNGYVYIGIRNTYTGSLTTDFYLNVFYKEA